MTPPNGPHVKPCGCEQRNEHSLTLCQFHWNEWRLRSELDEARRWDALGPLNPDDWSDRQVLNFYDQLCYWAAKGIGDAGSVGSIYSAANRRAIGGDAK